MAVQTDDRQAAGALGACMINMIVMGAATQIKKKGSSAIGLGVLQPHRLQVCRVIATVCLPLCR